MVVACGTGIEGCDELGPGSPLSECKADPRTKWRGMLIGLDASGNQKWSRTDSFVFPGENEAAASASEYVIRTQSGGYASIVDQISESVSCSSTHPNRIFPTSLPSPILPLFD